MKRILLLVAGVVGVLVGLGFIMPAVAWWRQNGSDGARVMLPLLLGGALVFGAIAVFAKGIRGARA